MKTDWRKSENNPAQTPVFYGQRSMRNFSPREVSPCHAKRKVAHSASGSVGKPRRETVTASKTRPAVSLLYFKSLLCPVGWINQLDGKTPLHGRKRSAWRQLPPKCRDVSPLHACTTRPERLF
jgi:hypothetical protein